MASKGITLKRKYQATFEHRADNLKNFRTWVEEFSPIKIEELAVHKKKVSELQVWIQNATNNHNKERCIILNGPPGVGKTATVKALCQSLGIEILIWSNKRQENDRHSNYEDVSCSRDRTYETQGESFSRFLLQSSKYFLYSHNQRIILIEEFPNVFLRDPTLFHSIIRRYAVHSYHPVVFIMSDNAKGESLESCLFPKDLQISLKIKNISFNAISPTMIMKVLTRINNSPKIHSCYKKLNKSEMESIAADSMGDIRSAINSMQFMCMSYFKKSFQENVSSSENASKRDSSLFLFHALGKILYSKRDATKKSNQDTLPTQLKMFERDPLISNPEEVFEKTSISAEAFTLFLQENYIPFVDDVKANFECALWLSEADYISALWNGRDTMSDYRVSLASRGLMFNMTSVNRKWRALHKPLFYENFSKQKQLEKSLKHAFKSTSLSMRQLQIDLIPYLLKLQPKDLNSAQIVVSKNIGDMAVKNYSRQVGRALEEKDRFHLEDGESKTVVEINSEKKPLVDETADDDEEIVIEEYDF